MVADRDCLVPTLQHVTPTGHRMVITTATSPEDVFEYRVTSAVTACRRGFTPLRHAAAERGYVQPLR